MGLVPLVQAGIKLDIALCIEGVVKQNPDGVSLPGFLLSVDLKWALRYPRGPHFSINLSRQIDAEGS